MHWFTWTNSTLPSFYLSDMGQGVNESSRPDYREVVMCAWVKVNELKGFFVIIYIFKLSSAVSGLLGINMTTQRNALISVYAEFKLSSYKNR